MIKQKATNKAILNAPKKKIDEKKGAWAEEIPDIIWSYKTIHKEATGETPFRMAYEAKGMIPPKVQIFSQWLEHSDEERNNEALCAETLDEVPDSALAWIISQKQAIARRYNSKVKQRHFNVGELVLRKAKFFTV